MNKLSSCLIATSVLVFQSVHATPYIGVNAGVNSVSISKSLTYPLNSELPAHAHYRSGYTNAHGQLLAGYYVWTGAQSALALEANADWYVGKTQYTVSNWFFNDSARAQERLRYGFGVYALPEYQLNPGVRLFAGPGLTYSQLSVRTGATAGNFGVSRAFNAGRYGWSLKTGAISHWTEQTDVVLSYQYNQYGAQSRTAVEPLSGERLKASYKPNANLFMIGLRYSWPKQTGFK